MPSRPPAAAPPRPKRKQDAAHQVLIASDATGHTAEVVVRAALAQFRGAEVQLVDARIFGLPRTCGRPSGRRRRSAA